MKFVFLDLLGGKIIFSYYLNMSLLLRVKIA